MKNCEEASTSPNQPYRHAPLYVHVGPDSEIPEVIAGQAITKMARLRERNCHDLRRILLLRALIRASLMKDFRAEIRNGHLASWEEALLGSGDVETSEASPSKIRSAMKRPLLSDETIAGPSKQSHPLKLFDVSRNLNKYSSENCSGGNETFSFTGDDNYEHNIQTALQKLRNFHWSAEGTTFEESQEKTQSSIAEGPKASVSSGKKSISAKYKTKSGKAAAAIQMTEKTKLATIANEQQQNKAKSYALGLSKAVHSVRVDSRTPGISGERLQDSVFIKDERPSARSFYQNQSKSTNSGSGDSITLVARSQEKPKALSFERNETTAASSREHEKSVELLKQKNRTADFIQEEKSATSNPLKTESEGSAQPFDYKHLAFRGDSFSENESDSDELQENVHDYWMLA